LKHALLLSCSFKTEFEFQLNLMTQEDIKLPPYHLHFLVFENKFEELRQTLQDCQKNSVQKQFNELLSIIFRGQTLLTLAISLNRQECVEILLEFGARTLQKNDFGWNAWHEAISYGNRDILYVSNFVL
jgi:Ankyrin repeats (3 copies)